MPNRLPGAGQGVGQKSLGVERVMINVGEESSVGFIATHGNPDSDEENGLIGIDALYRNSDWQGDKVVEARAWLQRSFTSGENGLQSGWGGQLSYPNDRILWSLEYKELSEAFTDAWAEGGGNLPVELRSHWAGKKRNLSVWKSLR